MVLNPHTFKPQAPPAVGQTARVVRSDASGVWVTPLSGDQRHPLGPCRGATRPDGAGGTEQLGTDVIVLLVLTADGPWVAAHQEV